MVIRENYWTRQHQRECHAEQEGAVTRENRRNNRTSQINFKCPRLTTVFTQMTRTRYFKVAVWQRRKEKNGSCMRCLEGSYYEDNSISSIKPSSPAVIPVHDDSSSSSSLNAAPPVSTSPTSSGASLTADPPRVEAAGAGAGVPWTLACLNFSESNVIFGLRKCALAGLFVSVWPGILFLSTNSSDSGCCGACFGLVFIFDSRASRNAKSSALAVFSGVASSLSSWLSSVRGVVKDCISLSSSAGCGVRLEFVLWADGFFEGIGVAWADGCGVGCADVRCLDTASSASRSSKVSTASTAVEDPQPMFALSIRIQPTQRHLGRMWCQRKESGRVQSVCCVVLVAKEWIFLIFFSRGHHTIR
eukprot:m.361027 g.361027  ORF g.361027 m.361027 type:complete len:360 (+) comp19282_c1_seq1:441-1520(+)